jgi:hypothetical protein
MSTTCASSSGLRTEISNRTAATLYDAHMFEPHFDRHVWIYPDNPNGVFAPFNPAVSCITADPNRTP